MSTAVAEPLVKKIKKTEPLEGQKTMFSNAGERIREISRAFRLSFTGVGGKRQLGDAQKVKIADDLNANIDRLDLSKKLINAKHPAVKAMNAAKSAVLEYFRSKTLPYPEGAVRLLPTYEEESEKQNEETADFVTNVRRLIESYYDAVEKLQNQWQSVIEQARMELGDIFDESDYPVNVVDLLGVVFEPITVELPEYYRHLEPREYEAARKLLVQKFEAAAEMQQQFVAKWFSQSVEQLVKSVTGYKAGEQRCFQDSVVDNIFAAFTEFKTKTKAFGIGEGTELEKTINRIIKLLSCDAHGRELRPTDVADELRNDDEYSKSVINNLEKMGEVLKTQTRAISKRRLIFRS